MPTVVVGEVGTVRKREREVVVVVMGSGSGRGSGGVVETWVGVVFIRKILKKDEILIGGVHFPPKKK